MWGQAIEVPGLGALTVWSVSCAPDGGCTAAGPYLDQHGYPGFVT